MDFNTLENGSVIIGEGLRGVMHYYTALVTDFARSGSALYLNGMAISAKVYTELPLKRAKCLYMGAIGEAPEVSRGPIRYLLGIGMGAHTRALYIVPEVRELLGWGDLSGVYTWHQIHTRLWWSPVVPYKVVFVGGSICVLTLSRPF